MKNTYLKSSTGMIHWGKNNAASCNGRSGKFTKISEEEARTSKNICKKCAWEMPHNH